MDQPVHSVLPVRERVLIATPCLDGNLCVEYVSSLMHTNQLATQHGILCDFTVLRGDCFIGKARDNLTKTFLSSECTSLFFIDADQGWDAAAFVRMVLDDHLIVAGAVPKKTDGLEFNGLNLDAAPNGDCYLENGMIRAKHVGTGFMRIRRAAIEKLIEQHPATYKPGDGSPHDLLHEVFPCGPKGDGDKRQFWGEDLSFCDRWLALGEHVWIDPNIDFVHIGRKTYKGNLYKFLEANGAVRQAASVAKSAPVIVDDFAEDRA